MRKLNLTSEAQNNLDLLVSAIASLHEVIKDSGCDELRAYYTSLNKVADCIDNIQTYNCLSGIDRILSVHATLKYKEQIQRYVREVTDVIDKKPTLCIDECTDDEIDYLRMVFGDSVEFKK